MQFTGKVAASGNICRFCCMRRHLILITVAHCIPVYMRVITSETENISSNNNRMNALRQCCPTRGPQATHSPWLLQLLHPFNGLFSRKTWVSRHEKGKPFWILLEQVMVGWQWHQLDHMQIIFHLALDRQPIHASTSPLSFYRPDALPAAQPTASKH